MEKEEGIQKTGGQKEDFAYKMGQEIMSLLNKSVHDWSLLGVKRRITCSLGKKRGFPKENRGVGGSLGLLKERRRGGRSENKLTVWGESWIY